MAEQPKSKKQRITFNTFSLYTLKIELWPTEIQPVIWRRLEVDGRISLSKLHHFIQAAFGWSDAHLHEFQIHGKAYSLPSPEDQFDDREIQDERKVFLNRLLAKNDVFTYIYDFGDDWQHIITVEDFIADDEADLDGGAYILDGAQATPPEDVGGIPGYQNFIEVITVNPDSKEAQEMRDWAGGNFDPQQFDKRLANAAIYRMMYNGWGGK
ncbi:MAG: plasmid pRiA4b ORF-3 family protein [Methylococcales bacterium]|nr:plasmid pRiA4b ORF-3 family protein [Methylococcales bacterium]